MDLHFNKEIGSMLKEHLVGNQGNLKDYFANEVIKVVENKVQRELDIFFSHNKDKIVDKAVDKLVHGYQYGNTCSKSGLEKLLTEVVAKKVRDSFVISIKEKE